VLPSVYQLRYRPRRSSSSYRRIFSSDRSDVGLRIPLGRLRHIKTETSARFLSQSAGHLPPLMSTGSLPDNRRVARRAFRVSPVVSSPWTYSDKNVVIKTRISSPVCANKYVVYLSASCAKHTAPGARVKYYRTRVPPSWPPSAGRITISLVHNNNNNNNNNRQVYKRIVAS